MMGQHLSQKSADLMNNDDMKNNNNTFKSNQNGSGMNSGLDGLSIFQNTMHSYNTLQKLSLPPQNPHQELYQLNQELLNRLKNLNMGYPTPLQTPVSTTSFTPSPTTGLPSFPTDSNFMFTNAATQNFLNNNSNNNNNNNNSINMVASSPIGTLNRSSSTYSTISPIGDSFDRSLDNINNNNISSSNESPFIKPLSQVGTLTTLDNDGKVKVLVPIEQQQQQQQYRERSSRGEDDYYNSDKRTSGGGTLTRPQQSQPPVLTPILSRGEKRNQSGNTVTLKVTDEAGNVTNQRKLPAQPLMITRSTSEKVPNRSQMMSHVQRTQWARHTTK